MLLHQDIIEFVTPEEIIELAYSEYETRLPKDADLRIRIATDDGGKHMEFLVQGVENASMLRGDLPPRYNDMRTVVVYSRGNEVKIKKKIKIKKKVLDN